MTFLQTVIRGDLRINGFSYQYVSERFQLWRELPVAQGGFLGIHEVDLSIFGIHGKTS